MANVDLNHAAAGEIPPEELDGAIAIVGMALRVPGASTLEQFWQNLRDGVESTTYFSEAELLAAGVDAASLADPLFVKAFARLEGADRFDAAFFDLTPREAEVLDPQHRQLLECAWEAMEHAGHGPGSANFKAAGRIGLFAGTGLNSYLLNNLIGRQDLLETLGGWQITLGNDKDFAVTRVAYKLDLQGPVANISTACSTSLVAVAQGCQSLLAYQSDLILAGGCSIHLPQDQGYWHHPGGTLSPDGRCRAFDAAAQGTLDGNGVAMVVLKRLEDALADGDTVHAVLRGYAINNDGANKVGYTAPSVVGQATVIREAQEMAGVAADSIGYVETHGTGTDLGDLVEITALTEAFRGAGVTGVGTCALGSLKTNVGHLDTAAGVASLIKTVLALQQRQIPPSLHFTRPNPKLNLEHSPFYVNARLREWPAPADQPRRAGVSSFGIGGTNAHVIVEAAAVPQAGTPGRPWQVLTVSARCGRGLEANVLRLTEALRKAPESDLADVAHSLQSGRRHFPERLALVVGSSADAVGVLADPASPRRVRARVGEHAPDVVFLLPGQESQYPNMARGLLRDEPLFKAAVDRCAEILRRRHGIDLAARMQPPAGSAMAYATDPIPLFVVQYALAQFWLALGVRPKALLGSSLGEYVCACLSGVLSLEDALGLAVAGHELLSVLTRAPLIGVSCSESELQPLLTPGTALAMVCAPRQCVVGGEPAAMAELMRRLDAAGLQHVPTPLDLPFHTAYMAPFIEPYRRALQRVHFNAPGIPYISCVTGDWIRADEASDPEHYLRLARQTVRLDRAFDTVFRMPDAIFLEVGPGQTMTGFGQLQPGRPPQAPVLSTLRDPRYVLPGAAGVTDETQTLASTVARLWTLGVDIDWAAWHAGERRRRLPLPTYAFNSQRFWLDPRPGLAGSVGPATADSAPVGKHPDRARWFYQPVWRQLPALAPAQPSGRWLVLGADSGLGPRLVARLVELGAHAVLAAPPVQLTQADAWDAVFATAEAGDAPFDQILYLGLLDLDVHADERAQLDAGFHAWVALGHALGRRVFGQALQLTLVAEGVLPFAGTDSESGPAPAKAACLGPARVLPQEYPNQHCRLIDVRLPSVSWQQARLIDQLLAECAGPERTLVLRPNQRWVERFEPDPNPPGPADTVARLRPEGVYLITGGLGQIGLTLAERIARRAPGARLVLTSRSGPAPEGSERARRVQALQALGAQVLVARADAADEAAMAGLVQQVRTEFGGLNGVIHAAGLVGQESFATVSESSPAFCARQIAPKLNGAQVLERVLGDQPLDFCLLCSSLSPLLGGLGFTAYAAANACLDSFVIQHNRRHPVQWTCVNWEGWMFDAAPVANQAGAAVAEMGLLPEEGVDLFERILNAHEQERIVISTGDLAARIRQWVELGADAAPEATATQETGPRHARPALLGEYEPPAGPVETELARLWQRLLGIDGIGALDNFFELGGNSLLLTQLLGQIRKAFQLELSLAALFERPTIRDTAALIEASRTAPDEDRDEGVL